MPLFYGAFLIHFFGKKTFKDKFVLNYLGLGNSIFFKDQNQGMSIIQIIQQGISQGVSALYQHDVAPDSVTINTTRKEFTGDYTVVVFPFTRAAKQKPEQIGESLGQYLVDNVEEIEAFNVIKGFLNLSISDQYWKQFLADISGQDRFGYAEPNGKKIMVEFSSPNTNKPLHLGHIRNILLGWSCSQILAAAGYKVHKVQIINDRGIAICKSMLAWQLFGEGETPENSGIKGDQLVGKYYVLFEQKFRAEYKAWQDSEAGQATYRNTAKEGQAADAFFSYYKNTYFNEHSDLGGQAKDMLLRWESNDPATRQLWSMMNSWVYQGFDETYGALGVSFDKLYYESDTYVLGKEYVEQGLKDGIFYQKEDSSVWIDLEDAKLDHKLVLRSDGTSVYMTQDIGTAELRYNDFGVDKMVYVVADEQDYHFKVLFEIMKRFGAPYAEGMYHLSYGMVDLPTGKMKSREGTVVDADDLIAEVIAEAGKSSEERGGLEGLEAADRADIFRRIGLAALKYFILRVNPRKRMVFDPQESVDLQGDTGPYIQNAFVRIQSIMRKVGEYDAAASANYNDLKEQERDLIIHLFAFPETIQQAAAEYDPSMIAAYAFDLARLFHRFYHDLPMIKAESGEAKVFRLQLSQAVAQALRNAMQLLGVEMPERM